MLSSSTTEDRMTSQIKVFHSAVELPWAWDAILPVTSVLSAPALWIAFNIRFHQRYKVYDSKWPSKGKPNLFFNLWNKSTKGKKRRWNLENEQINRIGASMSIYCLVCFVHTSAPLFYHVTHQSWNVTIAVPHWGKQLFCNFSERLPSKQGTDIMELFQNISEAPDI